jgi:hypothetical protein
VRVEIITGFDRDTISDVRDIISYLITFDTTSYNSTSQPLIAYKDKRACLRHFQENKSRLKKLYPLLPDILQLWDEIHLRWQGWYREGREEEAGIRGRFLKLTAVSEAPEAFVLQGCDRTVPDAGGVQVSNPERPARSD